MLESSGGGCGQFPARNRRTARGRFFAVSGQNAHKQPFHRRARSRVSRICFRSAPKRRLENDHFSASMSSQILLDCLAATTRAKPRLKIAILRLSRRGFAIFWPLLRLKRPTQAFVPSPLSHAKACPRLEMNSRKLCRAARAGCNGGGKRNDGRFGHKKTH